MEIIKLKLNDLKPYEKNAKQHPQEQIEQIKKSIQEFGMNDPIAIWGKDNIIVEGHGRLEALKELGYEEVDCIRLDHLSDEERRAYTLIHNKLTMNSDFDFDALDNELSDIDSIDMDDFGFDNFENNQNFIDDLSQNDFLGTTKETVNNFTITFVFNKKYEDIILYYIKQNGKEKIVNNMIEFIKGENQNA